MSIIKTETNQDVSDHRGSDDAKYMYFNCPNCKALNKFRIKDFDGKLDVKVADPDIGDSKISTEEEEEKDTNGKIDKILESNNKNIELLKKYCILGTRKTSNIKT